MTLLKIDDKALVPPPPVNPSPPVTPAPAEVRRAGVRADLAGTGEPPVGPTGDEYRGFDHCGV